MITDIRVKAKPFILSGLVLLADQISKAFIASRWPVSGMVIKDVFDNGFLWIVHVRNKAIAFSLGDALPEPIKMILFILLPLIVLGFLVWYFFNSDEFTLLQRWAIAGIIGGGLGNLIDRIFRPDGVVDFISVNFYGLLGLSRWPTFNIADSSVVICGILLFFGIIFHKDHEHEVTL